MKPITEFKFRFKESRDYVHGTDIYKSFCDHWQRESEEQLQSLQISFHGIARKNLELHEGALEDEKTKVLLSVIQKNGDRLKFSLRESDDAPSERYAYDEEAVVSGWAMGKDGLSGILEKPSPEYSTIESLVALNKAFLTELHKPKGKWLFARLKVKGFLPQHCEQMRLVTSASSNLRLVRSKIEIDGEYFGEIYFSLT